MCKRGIRGVLTDGMLLWKSLHCNLEMQFSAFSTAASVLK